LSWPSTEAAIQDNKFHLFGFLDWMAGSSQHIKRIDRLLGNDVETPSANSQMAFQCL